MWGKDDATMVGTMRHMWRMGRLKPFFAAYRVAGVREGVTLPSSSSCLCVAARG
jgi:hypothetical protein